MFGRVLVGTDLSEPAAAALAHARRLAPQARLRLVHVVPPARGLGLVGPEVLGTLEEAVRGTVEDAEAAVREAAKDVPGAEATVLVGGVAAELAREAEAWSADLVVVGARGHSRVQDLLLGSVARAVTRRVKGSVLVVRRDAPVRVVAVGTDFSPAAASAAATARDVASTHGAAVVAWHAADTAMWGEAGQIRRRGDGARERVEATLGATLHAFVAEHLPGAREVVVSARPVEAGARVARDVEADLLVVGDHGPGALERAFLGSVAEGLAERAPCNVLVVRDAPRPS